MMGKPPPFRPVPPPAPAGKINVTDPDSQLVKSLHGWVQGYTAQAAATPEQIIVAADVISGGNERNRLSRWSTRRCTSSPPPASMSAPRWFSPMPGSSTSGRSTVCGDAGCGRS